MKKVLLAALFCIFAIATNAYALPFSSSGWVNPYFGVWNPATASGTAQYTFYFENPSVMVNELNLLFEGDIFNLSQLDASDFTVVAPPGWTTSMFDESGTLRWAISGGAAINSTQDPITLNVNYVLNNANRMYSGNNVFAGDSTVWAWNEAQGANSPWSQPYYLYGDYVSGQYAGRSATSPGSTAPVPEPATMSLLGMGILGLFGLKKRS